MILRKILTLSLIATNLLIKINPVFSNTNYPIWEEEEGWITVIRSNQEVMKIKKDSITQEGKYKKATFAKFFQRYNIDTGEYIKDDYNVIVGEGYFQCGMKSDSKFNPANVDSVNFKSLKLFETKDDLKSGNFSKIDTNNFGGWRYLSGKIDAIYHYLCQDMNPSYLKPGMSMFDVKKLLYNGGFRIVELPELANTVNTNLCDTPKPCIKYGMTNTGYIIFYNKKTGVYLETSSIDNVLYSVKSTMNKLGY